MDGASLLKQYALGQRNFASSNLLETDLIAAELNGIDLSHSDLRQCRLGRANFSQADFQGADLSEALLWGTDLTFANRCQFTGNYHAQWEYSWVNLALTTNL
jgi:uncharacterized protein YjbI with pentapeptide repeats